MPLEKSEEMKGKKKKKGKKRRKILIRKLSVKVQEPNTKIS
jgi:hypothetical protein